MCHRVFWLSRLIYRRYLVTDRFFNFKIFAFWKYGQLSTGKFLTKITLWLTLALPSPPLPPLVVCYLHLPGHIPACCAGVTLELSLLLAGGVEGVLQRPPQPVFAAGVGIDVKEKKKKKPNGCVKTCKSKVLCQAAWLLNLGEYQNKCREKLAIFKNWFKRFICSSSDSCVC